MTVDKMRAIDRWVGVPLCFLLTFLVRLLAPAPGPDPARRILFVELSEMGSTILADPAMQKAKRVLGAELFFVIFAKNVASLGFLNTVPKANIFTLREDSLWHLALDALRFLAWTRRVGIDAVVDLELFSRVTALLSGLTLAPRRVGFFRFHNEGLYRGGMLTHPVAYNPHIHIAKNFIALINALASTRPETPYSKTLIGDDELVLPRVEIGAQAGADMARRVAAALPDFDAKDHRLVLLNPNASELLPQRRWPAARFAALARQTLERWPDIRILITGAPGERAEAEALCRAVGGPRIGNFAGGSTLTELPALYAMAAAMVTNDSGPGHFSAVTAMPSIVLFGPETPALYGSLGDSRPITAGLACSPCVSAANHRKTACHDPVCMTAITPERVLAALASILEPDRG